MTDAQTPLAAGVAQATCGCCRGTGEIVTYSASRRKVRCFDCRGTGKVQPTSPAASIFPSPADALAPFAGYDHRYMADAGVEDEYQPDDSPHTLGDYRRARAALASVAPAQPMGDVREAVGLGPQATIITDDEEGGFMPVSALRGSFVYIAQGGSQLTMSREVAARLAQVIAPHAHSTETSHG